MTEHQINQIKRLLQRNNTGQELNNKLNQVDHEILNAARQHAETLGDNSFDVGKTWFMPVFALSLSVIATAALFLVMNTMIHDNDLEHLAEIDSTRNKAVLDSLRVKQQESAISNQSISPLANIDSIAQPKSTPVSRDRILADLLLPDARGLARRMQPMPNQDRQVIELMLADAMLDIQTLLNKKDYPNARDRYQRLRQRCQPCELPESLEALASIEAGVIDSG